MLIKLLTEARKGRENSSAKRDKSPSGGRVLTATYVVVGGASWRYTRLELVQGFISGVVVLPN